MLNICKSFSVQTGLTFNARKTMCIKFHCGQHMKDIVQYPLYLGQERLQWYSEVNILGMFLIVVLVLVLMLLTEKDNSLGVLIELLLNLDLPILCVKLDCL